MPKAYNIKLNKELNISDIYLAWLKTHKNHFYGYKKHKVVYELIDMLDQLERTSRHCVRSPWFK